MNVARRLLHIGADAFPSWAPRRWVRCAALSAVMAAMAAPGCASSASDLASSAVDGPGVRVAIRLDVGPGVTISTVRWTIHHPTLLSADLTGSVDLSRSQSLQFLLGGLPAGKGYTISATATTDGSAPVDCPGESLFDVVANMTTGVALSLVCPGSLRPDSGANGSIAVSVATVVCAKVSAVTANRPAAPVGGSIDLTALLSQADGSGHGVSYAWAINGGPGAGSFAGAASASATFTCTAPGAVTAGVTVTTDGGVDCVPSTALVALSCQVSTTAAISVSPGSHACALLPNGTAKCWGDNVAGQLGDGTTNESSSPVAVAGLAGASAIATGNVHTCALLSTDSVVCWGNQAAIGSGPDAIADDCAGLPCSLAPSPVVGLTGVQAIAAGATHTCALLSGGTVRCWGDNASGEAGDGTKLSPQLAPVAVAGLSGPVKAIALGDAHSCALLSDGTVQCWGYNYSGQLGNGVRGPDSCSGFPCSLKPMTVVGLGGVTAIAAGGSRTCALLSGGTVDCWGFNDASGELGNGTKTNSSVPVAVSNVTGAAAISAGVYHTCALLSDGSVECWGNNSVGPTVTPVGAFCDATTITATTPLDEPNLSGATAISAGGYETCQIRFGGAVTCCGRNALGQLGDGTLTPSAMPVRVGL